MICKVPASRVLLRFSRRDEYLGIVELSFFRYYLIMRRFFVVTILFLSGLSVKAQEKVMNIQKADGTSTQVRVVDLKQINFLTVDEGGRGLLVKTLGGETIAVLFEASPVVTFFDGRLIVKSSLTDAVEVEITNIAEILFGDASGSSVSELKGSDFVLQPASSRPRARSRARMDFSFI